MDYRDLIVWQKAMALARCAECYGLIPQIRRAAVSIPSNIAEGYGRLTDLQFRHFLGNARGSVYELRTQIELASDLGFVDPRSIQQVMQQSTEVMRLINGLIASLKTGRGDQAAPSSASNTNSASSAKKELHS